MIFTAKNTKAAKAATERTCIRSKASPGFTRLELLVVGGALALLACVTLPGLAGTRPRTDRVVCANNLRQIGQAFNLWADDYNDCKPLWVPFSSGGLGQKDNVGPLPDYTGMAGNAWFNFAWISNELRTPKMLLCPADAGRNVKVARDFSESPLGGFLNPNYRDQALSYFMGLHAYPGLATALLSGDRNVGGAFANGCSTFPTLALNLVAIHIPEPAPWKVGLHGGEGNLLLNDGRVILVSSADLINVVQDRLRGEGTSVHVLPPAR